MKTKLILSLALLLSACGVEYTVNEPTDPADPLVVATSTAPTQDACDLACARLCLVEVHVDGHIDRYVDDECLAKCSEEHCS